MQKRLILVFAVLSLFLVQIAYADIGPHTPASLNFKVTYNNQPITEKFRADILTCQQENCERPDNTDECTQSLCHFYYYRIERVPSNMRLQFTLQDKIFTSGFFIFSSRTSPRESYYEVNINPDGKMAIIDDKGEVKQYERSVDIIRDNRENKISGYNSSLLPFAYAILLTILIELAVLAIFLKKWKVKKWKKTVLSVVSANIISLPLVWTIIISVTITISSPSIAITVGEAFAIVFEAYFIHWLNKQTISLKKAFILSAVMNAASFVIGGIILALS